MQVEPLCHRDMKPGNVLLALDGTPVLMDFGSIEPGLIEVTTRKQAVAQQVRRPYTHKPSNAATEHNMTCLYLLLHAERGSLRDRK